MLVVISVAGRSPQKMETIVEPNFTSVGTYLTSNSTTWCKLAGKLPHVDFSGIRALP